MLCQAPVTFPFHLPSAFPTSAGRGDAASWRPRHLRAAKLPGHAFLRGTVPLHIWWPPHPARHPHAATGAARRGASSAGQPTQLRGQRGGLCRPPPGQRCGRWRIFRVRAPWQRRGHTHPGTLAGAPGIPVPGRRDPCLRRGSHPGTLAGTPGNYCARGAVISVCGGGRTSVCLSAQPSRNCGTGPGTTGTTGHRE